MARVENLYHSLRSELWQHVVMNEGRSEIPPVTISLGLPERSVDLDVDWTDPDQIGPPLTGSEAGARQLRLAAIAAPRRLDLIELSSPAADTELPGSDSVSIIAKHRAAVTIQAVFRGHNVRSKSKLRLPLQVQAPLPPADFVTVGEEDPALTGAELVPEWRNQPPKELQRARDDLKQRTTEAERQLAATAKTGLKALTPAALVAPSLEEAETVLSIYSRRQQQQRKLLAEPSAIVQAVTDAAAAMVQAEAAAERGSETPVSAADYSDDFTDVSVYASVTKDDSFSASGSTAISDRPPSVVESEIDEPSTGTIETSISGLEEGLSRSTAMDSVSAVSFDPTSRTESALAKQENSAFLTMDDDDSIPDLVGDDSAAGYGDDVESGSGSTSENLFDAAGSLSDEVHAADSNLQRTASAADDPDDEVPSEDPGTDHTSSSSESRKSLPIPSPIPEAARNPTPVSLRSTDASPTGRGTSPAPNDPVAAPPPAFPSGMGPVPPPSRGGQMQQYSATALYNKATAELQLYEALDESILHLSNVNSARQIAEAQRESTVLAEMLGARKQEHDVILNKFKADAEIAAGQTKLAQDRADMAREQTVLDCQNEAAAELRRLETLLLDQERSNAEQKEQLERLKAAVDVTVNSDTSRSRSAGSRSRASLGSSKRASHSPEAESDIASIGSLDQTPSRGSSVAPSGATSSIADSVNNVSSIADEISAREAVSAYDDDFEPESAVDESGSASVLRGTPSPAAGGAASTVPDHKKILEYEQLIDQSTKQQLDTFALKLDAVYQKTAAEIQYLENAAAKEGPRGSTLQDREKSLKLEQELVVAQIGSQRQLVAANALEMKAAFRRALGEASSMKLQAKLYLGGSSGAAAVSRPGATADDVSIGEVSSASMSSRSGSINSDLSRSGGSVKSARSHSASSVAEAIASEASVDDASGSRSPPSPQSASRSSRIESVSSRTATPSSRSPSSRSPSRTPSSGSQSETSSTPSLIKTALNVKLPTKRELVSKLTKKAKQLEVKKQELVDICATQAELKALANARLGQPASEVAALAQQIIDQHAMGYAHGPAAISASGVAVTVSEPLAKAQKSTESALELSGIPMVDNDNSIADLADLAGVDSAAGYEDDFESGTGSISESLANAAGSISDDIQPGLSAGCVSDNLGSPMFSRASGSVSDKVLSGSGSADTLGSSMFSRANDSVSYEIPSGSGSVSDNLGSPIFSEAGSVTDSVYESQASAGSAGSAGYSDDFESGTDRSKVSEDEASQGPATSPVASPGASPGNGSPPSSGSSSTESSLTAGIGSEDERELSRKTVLRNQLLRKIRKKTGKMTNEFRRSKRAAFQMEMSKLDSDIESGQHTLDFMSRLYGSPSAIRLLPDSPASAQGSPFRPTVASPMTLSRSKSPPPPLSPMAEATSSAQSSDSEDAATLSSSREAERSPSPVGAKLQFIDITTSPARAASPVPASPGTSTATGGSPAEDEIASVSDALLQDMLGDDEWNQLLKQRMGLCGPASPRPKITPEMWVDRAALPDDLDDSYRQNQSIEDDGTVRTDKASVEGYAKKVVRIFAGLGCAAGVLPLDWETYADVLRHRSPDHGTASEVQQIHNHLVFDCVNHILLECYCTTIAAQTDPWVTPRQSLKGFRKPPATSEVEGIVLAKMALYNDFQNSPERAQTAILSRQIDVEEVDWVDYSREEAAIKVAVADALLSDMLDDAAVIIAPRQPQVVL